MYSEKCIKCDSIDFLVKNGIKYIQRNGVTIKTHAGDALQANNVTYVLNNSYNRIHTLRYDKALKYFMRELLAYFYGSLDVDGNGVYGLSKASKFWIKLKDENNMINSNYGYYIFHRKTNGGLTQLQWIRNQFKENIETRKALININSIEHKKETKDFPCTVGLVFRIENNILNCDVQSRSTDVVTGLPYDMGFFSVVNEILAGLLSVDLNRKIIPGYVAMHSSFTQIYEKTAGIANDILHLHQNKVKQQMPKICNAVEVLEDIYNLGKKKPKTEFMKWVVENAK